MRSPTRRILTQSDRRFRCGVAAFAVICFCVATLITACANRTESQPAEQLYAPQPAPPPQPAAIATPETTAKPSGHKKTGATVRASYQGTNTAGLPTASGEPYDPDALTAASHKYKLGSTLKVTNPETGRSVNVRINDRGPLPRGRSLDLSKSAAERLGITDKGVARVKVTPVSSHPRPHQIVDKSEGPSSEGTPRPSADIGNSATP